MTVVTRLSTVLSNYEATPRITTPPYLAGANPTVGVATIATGGGDGVGTIYKFAFVPSSARIQDIQMRNDSTGGTGSYSLGIYTNDYQPLNLNGTGGSGPLYPTWDSSTYYVINNIVLYNNVVYTCVTGNINSVPPSSNWITDGAANLAPGSALATSPSIFGTNVSTQLANPLWESIYYPTLMTSSSAIQSASNATLRVWELLGMQQDPFYDFTLALTVTNYPGAGNIVLAYTLVR